ncbi:MAG: tetratricopeptide repeat protein [Anaerolineales bacterium]
MHYLFKHVLLRDVAYDIQLRSRLRELHRRAAEAIETLYADDLAPYYVDLAYHYGQAELDEQERHYAFLAGKQAASEYANEAAVRFLSRALELTPQSDREGWYQILAVRERIYDLQGYRDQQRKDLQMLLVFAKGENKVKMILRQAHFAELVGNYTDAVSFAQRAAQLAQRYENVRLEATAYLRWGAAIWRQGRYEEATPHFEKARDLALRHDLSDIEARGLHNIGVVHSAQGRLDEAMACYQDALSRYRTIQYKKGEGAALNNISITLLKQGEYVKARYYSEQARQLKELIGDHIGAGIAYATLGEIAQQLGQYDEALAYRQRALQISQLTADSPGESEIHIGLAHLYHLMGAKGRAEEHVQQGMTIARALQDTNLEAEAQLCWGHIYVGAEKLAEAEAAYTRAWELREDLHQPYRAIEARAGLTYVALTREDWAAAYPHVEAILSYVAAHPSLDGIAEPCWIYMACYRVLAAAQDARAPEVLAQAYDYVQTKAAKIEDDALRRSFLENVAVHRELLAAYQRHRHEK